MARRWEGKQAEAGRPAGKQASRAGKLVKKTVVGTQTIQYKNNTIQYNTRLLFRRKAKGV